MTSTNTTGPASRGESALERGVRPAAEASRLDALWRRWEEKSEAEIRAAYNAPRNTSERTRHEERSDVFHICADALREALERLEA